MKNITKLQDGDGHWYWIPDRLLCEFKNDLSEILGMEYMDNPDIFDLFIEKYDKYRTLGDPNLIPNFYKYNE